MLLLSEMSLVNQVFESDDVLVLSVVLPHSQEVGLLGDLLGSFMRESNIILADQLRGHLSVLVPDFLELSSSLLSGSINTEKEWLILIAIFERVDVLVFVVQMSTISQPSFLRHLVEEES